MIAVENLGYPLAWAAIRVTGSDQSVKSRISQHGLLLGEDKLADRTRFRIAASSRQ